MINPHDLFNLAIVGAVALSATVIVMAGVLFPSISTPRSKPVLSAANIICRSHDMLAQLQPSAPDEPTNLFSILRLDPSIPPFDPADDCAYPYSPNYKAAKQAVRDARATMSDSHDGDMREWRDVFSMAAFTLLNDTSRIVYMKDVLPNLNRAKGKGGMDKVLREFCQKT
ncbi:hypothetical protein CDV36_016038 [Fusarium kuroshium]|uniref:Uncharacterized protein n=1 Tax=Fusarium kuroshium TaxID=2010991 RepID=A0A3M2R1H5_9HYPO|nr:hypothetical protein CDV36_016038 [Fusarium kuroshium]